MQSIYTEPIVISDTFVSGVADIEDTGEGTVRLTLFVRQKSLYDYAGSSENIINARIVLTSGALMDCVRLVMRHFGMKCCGALLKKMH